MLMDRKIKAWLDELPKKKRDLPLKVRDIILMVDPSTKEDIKWGSLTFLHNRNIAWILNYPQREYINFGFFRATELSDPKGLLEGSGKGLRHVKISGKENIDVQQFIVWVKEAIELNQKKPLARKPTLRKKA